MIDWNFDKYYTILWQLFTIAYKQALVIVLLHQHFLATALSHVSWPEVCKESTCRSDN